MLVSKYLSGKTIENKEELENNMSFMKEAIKRTNNKDLYYSCGADLKINIDFVEFLFKKFNDDEDFLFNVSHNWLCIINEKKDYFVNSYSNKKVMSFVLYMSELEKIYNGKKGFAFNALLFSYSLNFLWDMNQKYGKYGKDFNDGFTYISKCFEGNNELIHFFAKNVLLDSLISLDSNNLQNFVKEYFSSYDEIYSDLELFIYNYLVRYDKALAEYVISSDEIINEVFNKIINNVDDFNIDEGNNEKQNIIKLSNYRR